MRTREEQIIECAQYLISMRKDCKSTEYDLVECIIHETEQRVRAEIDDEVKKLRRENVLVRERVSQLFDSYGAYDRPCKQFVLQTIDAAREVG